MNVTSILNSVMGATGAGIDKVVQTAQSSTAGGGLSGGLPGGLPGGLVGGGIAGGLAALLLTNKKARKIGGKALAYGGMAAVGGLAYKAYRDHKAAQETHQPVQNPDPGQVSHHQPEPTQIAPPPQGSIFDLAQAQSAPNGEDMRLVLIRAMISAAKADGHIDGEERTRIEAHIDTLGIGQEEQQFLVDQLNAPSDPISIARLSSGMEQAAEIYAASALAVDVDTPEERRYLDRLGDALLLPDDLRQRLEAETANR